MQAPTFTAMPTMVEREDGGVSNGVTHMAMLRGVVGMVGLLVV